MKNVAILLAGGTGSRFGEKLPKQFLPLSDGRSLLQTCIDTFLSCDLIDDIWVVMHRDWIQAVPTSVHAIEGGKERWESSYNAIQAVSRHYQEDVNVWIHDVARPFVGQTILQQVGDALARYEAVSVAVPVTDTIYQVRPSTCDVTVQSIPLRSTMMRAQTPQAFRLSLIKTAFDLALSDPDGIHVTDDAGIVLHYLPDTLIHIVAGDETNRKITFRNDIPRQKQLGVRCCSASG